MPRIEKLFGREILDSRGQPTVKATCILEGGVCASASVPSGASTGRAEVFQLRDGNPTRYRGLGTRRAVAIIGGEIHTALAGCEFSGQVDLDSALIDLDGTPRKSRLGGNAILAVSLAFARASARRMGVALFEYFADMASLPVRALPRLTINLFSGGKHAGKQVCIQDVLMVPLSAATVDDALAAASKVYAAAEDLAFKNYNMRALTADEGGLAPPFGSAEEMIGAAVESIRMAGYTPGRDFALGVDLAASHFYSEGRYQLDSRDLESEGVINTISMWLDTFPIISIEDGLAEDDWEHWPRLRAVIAGRALTLGDDFLCTNPARIQRAVSCQGCDALLLKVNQIGTLTEALAACRMARNAGWSVTLSVRSGETEDDWAADLAVGWGADHFKPGSIRQSERLAKYNRLLEIAELTGLPLATWYGSSMPGSACPSENLAPVQQS